MGFCLACQQEAPFETDPASGTSFCSLCGSVVEENGIVAEVTFGENASGAAVLQGSYVGADQTRARATGGRGAIGGTESREHTISQARQRINQIVNALRLPDRFVDRAQRFFVLALNSNFVRGRRSGYVICACLYIVCRLENWPSMLVDFAELQEVNVFILGATYLRLVKQLALPIPALDPSLFISRFAHMLEFGDETQRVAHDAVRLTQRFNRDWMTAGRRPAGICGACLILAARMNNFRRSIEEIVQVVKIADSTVKKRLEEFGQTESSALTITDFRSVWFDEGANPPAFTAGLEKDKKRKREEDQKVEMKALDRKERKVRFQGYGIFSDDEDEIEEDGQGSRNGTPSRAGLSRPEARDGENGLSEVAATMAAMQAAGGEGLAGEEEDPQSNREGQDGDDASNANDDETENDEQEDEDTMLDRLAADAAADARSGGFNLGEDGGVEQADEGTSSSSHKRKRGRPSKKDAHVSRSPSLPASEPARTAEELAAEQAEQTLLVGEIASKLSQPDMASLSTELAKRERLQYERAQRLEPYVPGGSGGYMPDPELDPELDEEELDDLILDEEEVRIKERLWMEFNMDYLANIAEKKLREQLDEKPVKKKPRKARAKPADSSNPSGATAPEAARNLLKQKKFSKKINYSALETLLGNDAENGEGGGKTTLFDEDEEGYNYWDDNHNDGRSSRSASVLSTASRRSHKRSSSTGSGKKSSKRSKSAEKVAEKMRSRFARGRGSATPDPQRGAVDQEDEEDEEEGVNAVPEEDDWQAQLRTFRGASGADEDGEGDGEVEGEGEVW